MSKGKCILLVRVSTQRQDFDEQECQLYDLAIADGYKDSEIIPICEKESGIKLKEEERKGLNRLKEEIEKGGVTCVYAWEVSRIGRKKKVIFSIVEYLVEHRIQLIVKEPYIKLLDPDGSINDGSETVLTLFAQISESEMRNKQARWKRTRVANAAKGKFNGGKSVKFGYRLDGDNYYVVDEEEAKVIRTLYDIYTNSRNGQRTIRREMEQRGYRLTEDRIRKVLSDEGYTGKPYRTRTWDSEAKRYVEKNLIQYPAIIDEKTFEKARLKREEANKSVYRGAKYFFASGLIKCPKCGHSYTGFDWDNLYMCIAHRHANTDIPQCDNNLTVNLTALDSLLWHLASARHFKWLYENSEAQRANLTNELEVIEEKIARERSVIDGVEERLGDIAEMVIDRMLTKEKGKAKAQAIREEAEQAQARINAYRQRQSSINELLSNDDKSQVAALISALDGILDVETLKQMSDVVHKYITKVEIDKYEYDEVVRKNGAGPYRVVTVHYIDGVCHRYLVYARGETFRFTSYDLETPEIDNVKIITRGKKGNSRLSMAQRKKRNQNDQPT